MAEATLRTAHFADLTTRQLHDLLRLRVDVFVVEQACPYPEIDGRDVDPDTEHLWLEVDGEPAAYLRLLGDRQHPAEWVIGRVVTAAGHRGAGHAARLMRAALERVGEAPVRLSAQAHLESWYDGFGFARAGADFVEDGIPHLPMKRPGGGAEPGPA